MITGVVNTKSFIPSGYRFDPDIHLSEGVQVRREIAALTYEISNVGENAERVFYGNIFSRIFVKKPEFGVEYLAASDTVLTDLSTGRYLSIAQANRLSYLKIKKDWILVTCSGTLGNISYTNGNYLGKIATHDLIRIVPNDNKVKRGTLYAFLASKYGYHQITQSQFGGVVKHINDSQTMDIKVPVFPDDIQLKTDSLIKESAELREKAQAALNEGKLKLKNYISFPYEHQNYKTGIVSSKDVWKSLQHRLDPPALMNDGVLAMKDVTSHMQHSTIGDINAIVRRPGIFKRNYVANGIPYIKGSEIFLNNPFRRCEHLSRTRTPFIDEMTLYEGQILITCAGSVGSVKMITKEYEDKKAIGSQDIIRLISNDELYTREYLFTYLQMPFVYDYIQSMKYGSVIERIEPFHVESIPVVTPTKELSEEITLIIKRYMDYTYRAFIAEENAIQIVEEEIEKWNK